MIWKAYWVGRFADTRDDKARKAARYESMTGVYVVVTAWLSLSSTPGMALKDVMR